MWLALLLQSLYEVTGDTAVNMEHYGPRKARQAVQTGHRRLLEQYEVCCMGDFDQLSKGTTIM